MQAIIAKLFRIIMAAGFGFAACIVAGTVAIIGGAPAQSVPWIMIGSFAFGAYAGWVRK